MCPRSVWMKPGAAALTLPLAPATNGGNSPRLTLAAPAGGWVGVGPGGRTDVPPLLEVKDLHTEFRTGAGTVRAVDGVSYTVDPGETIAIVGESGSGKSVGARSILRLIPDPPGRITQGQILFAGRDLLSLSADEMRAVRGNEIGMVFQE